MRQLFLKGGEVSVENVPPPNLAVNEVLVRTHFSSISSGTELASKTKANQSLVLRAIREPHNVSRALEFARARGIPALVERARGSLSLGSPSGYSLAGVVSAIGSNVTGFSPGDRVAVAGAGVANHAEYVSAPVNLCCKIPENVALKHASTGTIGAIALQSVRRLQPTIGETVVVIGLGLIGQITAQILVASGCRVIGVDTDDKRAQEASSLGLLKVLDPKAEELQQVVLQHTGNFGADGVVITASTSSSGVVNESMKICRRKGRVVVVGDVGLSLRRDLWYEKELDLLISTSYGPGRYDPDYEEKGLDYPLPFVRWTLGRNISAYLELLSSGTVSINQLRSATFEFSQAAQAFDALGKTSDRLTLAYLDYKAEEKSESVIGFAPVSERKGRLPKTEGPPVIGVGVVGASSFFLSTHLPLLKADSARFRLVSICSKQPAKAEGVRRQHGFDRATADFEELIADPDVDLVLVMTRHDLHGTIARKAIEAGKHVLLEKPLTIFSDELDWFRDKFIADQGTTKLSLGFNRRFAPITEMLQEKVRNRNSPLVINYRVNAGRLPLDHWVYSTEGGGRNLGEACHFYDFFIALTGGLPEEISVVGASGANPTDRFAVSMRMSDGSLCSLSYFDAGSRRFDKERVEVSWDSKTVVINDFRSSTEDERFRYRGRRQDKGFKSQWTKLYASVLAEQPLIPLSEVLASSDLSFRVESALRIYSGEQPGGLEIPAVRMES